MNINLQSIQSLLTQFGIGATPTPVNSTANFSDYLMTALDDSQKVSDKDNGNGLYELIAGNSTSSSMQGLLGLGDSSILTQYLQGDAATTNGVTALDSTTQPNTADMFSSYLQNSFQAKITSSMNAAKMKLETDLNTFRANNDPNDELVKLRLAEMENNVAIVTDYLQPKTTEAPKLTTEQQLMELLNNNAAYNKYLVNLNS